MATWYSVGQRVYNNFGSGDVYSSLGFNTTTVNLDDGEPDTSFEVPDIVVSANSGVFLGTVNVPLAAGGSVFLPVTQNPSAPNVALVYIPSGTTEADYNFPATINLTGLNEADYPVCFAAGTLIKTPGAERLVEHLAVGDCVTTASGDTVPILWIGRQTLRGNVFGAHSQLVRIRAGALGDGLPHSDLTVTADHGMIIDGLVINASALVNGTTISFVPQAELEDICTVYHVETEAHDVILANGAPSETFIDYRDRRAFDNFNEYLDLYGAERIIPEMPRPRISSRRMLPQEIQNRLEPDDASMAPDLTRLA